MISEGTIQEVKDRANLVDIISEQTPLKRQGSSYTGLCPFHNEKTPSFHVRDGGKFYHCFGCGASGNAISYVMQTKGLSFPQAVELLAERYGINIVLINAKGKEKKVSIDKTKYFTANKLTYKFFRESLSKAPTEVIDYLKARGLNKQARESYGIGFAPLAWRALSDYLRDAGVEENVMIECGLARRNMQGELYDCFRGRLMFPIWNDSRNIAAFGGRIIPAIHKSDQLDQAPKYINSPESPIYHKSRTLFGMPQALDTIRSEKALYLVEGYMDVVSLWMSGVKNVLATCGTALTESHARRISFLAQRVYILFDGDDAGRAAAAKSFSTFINSGIDVHVLFLPKSEDPDSIARTYGDKTKEYLEKLERHAPINCYISNLLSKYAANSVVELGAALKGQVCKDVAMQLKAVKNVVEREVLIRQAAFRLKVEQNDLMGLTPQSTDSKKSANEKTNIEQGLEEEVTRDENLVFIQDVNTLPMLDRDILLTVMALRGNISEQVLRDPDLMLNLTPSARAFVESFSELVRSIPADNPELKTAIKTLLKQFGPSWLRHWKMAHEVLQDPNSNLEKSYYECVQRVKKNKLIQAVSEIKAMMKGTIEENQKIDLAERQLMLQRQLSSL